MLQRNVGFPSTDRHRPAANTGFEGAPARSSDQPQLERTSSRLTCIFATDLQTSTEAQGRFEKAHLLKVLRSAIHLSVNLNERNPTAEH